MTTFKVIDRRTGEVYAEMHSVNELCDMASTIYNALDINIYYQRTEREKDNTILYYHFSAVTPELLAMLRGGMPIMDKVAGVLMLALIVVLTLGLGGWI